MIKHSGGVPSGKSSGLHEDDSSQEVEPPTPTEFIDAIVYWLKHWWDAPREKSKAADWLTAIVTIIVAAAAIWSAWIFQRQLNVAIESSRIDARAWVEIGPIAPVVFQKNVPQMFGGGKPKTTTTFRYDIVPRNVGKTTAYDVEIRGYETHASGEWGSNTEAIASLQDRRMMGKYKEVETGEPIPFPSFPMQRAIGPNTTATISASLGGQGPTTFRDGTMYFSYFVGRIDYTDAFKVSHWIKFCFFIEDEKGQIGYCREGNDEDRNPEN